jgi:hypothetical protein
MGSHENSWVHFSWEPVYTMWKSSEPGKLALCFGGEDMNTGGAAVMARPKGRPKSERAAVPAQTPRITIINLKGSEEQSEWLEKMHRRTHLSKSVIVRLALALWAEQNKHPSFPSSESEDDQ